MANFINTPNMFLPVPTVGVDPGPDYAINVDNCFGIIDQHNHSNGSGVQINPSGIDINTALTFNNNFASNVAGVTFNPQLSTPGVGTIYESGVDLFYVDGLGNNIQITAAGGVAGTPGSISNLTPPASASYVAVNETFVWQSDVNIAANMDFGAAIFRNLTPNSTFGVTVQAPAALSSNYTLTLPSLPNAQKFMTLDQTGAIAAPWTVDGSTIQIIGNQLVATTQNTAATETEVNTGTDNVKYVTPLTLQARNGAVVFDSPATYTWTAPAGISIVTVYGRGGGGGGGSGTSHTTGGNASGGGGGSGTVSYPMVFQVTPGTQYTVVVGAGGAGGVAATGNPSNGNAGSNGSPSSFNGIAFNNIGLGGAGGVQGGSAAGGATQFNPLAGAGGAGSTSTASNGNNSIYASGGSAGTGNGAGLGGGGGGGAGDGAGAGGGNGSSAGGEGNDATNGGGGGGSGGNNASTSGRGGNGSPGKVVIVYGNAYTSNTNT